MFTQLKNWTAFICLIFAFAANSFAQGPCTTYSTPAWIIITNITPHSATATWEGVGTGAWYRVELKNLNTGIVEDLVVTQSTSRNYNALASGTHYQVQVEASSCEEGPFGMAAIQDFYTPIIITDDVVMLESSPQPNRQRLYPSASNHVTQSQFTICIYKVDNLADIDTLNDVFHAYIQLTNGDFFEFLMVGSQDNAVHHSLTPLAVPLQKWAVTGYDDNNAIVDLYTGAHAFTLKVKHEDVPGSGIFIEKMTITCADMLVQPDVLPLSVTLAEGVSFYASDNNSGVCNPGSHSFSSGQPPIPNHSGPKSAVSPNPFSDALQLELPADAEGPVQVRIVDLTGQIRFETNAAVGEALSRSIPTDDWAPGIYYVQIRNTNGLTVKPVVKI